MNSWKIGRQKNEKNIEKTYFIKRQRTKILGGEIKYKAGLNGLKITIYSKSNCISTWDRPCNIQAPTSLLCFQLLSKTNTNGEYCLISRSIFKFFALQ